jgi:hypothetical protein
MMNVGSLLAASILYYSAPASAATNNNPVTKYNKQCVNCITDKTNTDGNMWCQYQWKSTNEWRCQPKKDITQMLLLKAGCTQGRSFNRITCPRDTDQNNQYRWRQYARNCTNWANSVAAFSTNAAKVAETNPTDHGSVEWCMRNPDIKQEHTFNNEE